MKKAVAFVLALSLAFVLAGCGAQSGASGAQGLPVSSTETDEIFAVDRSWPALDGAVDAQSVTIEAPSLANSLLGDMTQRPIGVLLPPGYADGDASYPVVYFLGGYSDQISPRLEEFQAILERLYAKGAIPEMIVVVVSGANRLGASWYANSPVTGNWQDFITKDIVGYVDATYRTVQSAEGRALLGHSMGGFGVLSIATECPGLFGIVWAQNPAILAEDGFDGFGVDFDKLSELVQHYAALGPQTATAEYINGMNELDGGLYWSLSYASAFAPNPAADPPFILLPAQDGAGNRQKDEVYRQYSTGLGNWPARIDAGAENLKQLQLLVIEHGTNDYGWILSGCEELGAELVAAGVPHHKIAYEGDHHTSIYLRFEEIILPYLGLMFDGG